MCPLSLSGNGVVRNSGRWGLDGWDFLGRRGLVLLLAQVVLFLVCCEKENTGEGSRDIGQSWN